MVQTAQENRAYRSYVDLFGTARKLQVQVAIPFLSRYLGITRPSIICSYSSVVYGAFALSLFNDFWNRIDQDEFKNNYNAFCSVSGYPENLTRLLGFTDGAANLKCATISQNVLLWKHIGKVSLCCYGPSQDDFCLLLPSRDTGYLKSDPIIQKELCYDLFFTHVFLEKLEAMLAANLEDQGINDPMDLDTAARKIFYQNLCQEFNTAIKRSNLWEPYQDNNRAIENHYFFVTTRRQEARLRRRGQGQPPEDESDTGSVNDEDDMGGYVGEDNDEGDEDDDEDDSYGLSKPNLRKIKLGRKFVGTPCSEERLEQMIQDIDNYHRAKEFGQKSCVPAPLNGECGSEEYLKWFALNPECANMVRSANAIHRS